jgi:hypothetical protein
VEIPARLKHLRTDRRGIPVPFVNLWGPEDENRLRIGYDRCVGGLAVFQDDDDQDVPDFTRQNIQRQRECMVDGLCQVCARPVPWSRRFLIVSSISVEAVKVPLRGELIVVTEPWLDGFCARFALEKCPGLIRRKTAKDLDLVSVRSKLDVEMVVSSGTIDGPLAEMSQTIQPFMWAKLYLSRLRIITRP